MVPKNCRSILTWYDTTGVPPTPGVHTKVARLAGVLVTVALTGCAGKPCTPLSTHPPPELTLTLLAAIQLPPERTRRLPSLIGADQAPLCLTLIGISGDPQRSVREVPHPRIAGRVDHRGEVPTERATRVEVGDASASLHHHLAVDVGRSTNECQVGRVHTEERRSNGSGGGIAPGQLAA